MPPPPTFFVFGTHMVRLDDVVEYESFTREPVDFVARVSMRGGFAYDVVFNEPGVSAVDDEAARDALIAALEVELL